MNRLQILRDYLATTTFFTDPASSHHHLAIEGGLLTHSLNLYQNLRKLTRSLDLKWEDSQSPSIIALAHDMCKIGRYKKDESGYHTCADADGRHAELSLERVQAVIPLTDEEIACIRWHMGAFDDTNNWSKYTEAIHKFPNVLWVHTADMAAAHIDEVEL